MPSKSQSLIHMQSSKDSTPSFGNQVINISLTLLVFAFFTFMLRPFVPAHTPELKWLFSAFTATTITVVFFFAVNMFRVVHSDHKARTKNQ